MDERNIEKEALYFWEDTLAEAGLLKQEIRQLLEDGAWERSKMMWIEKIMKKEDEEESDEERCSVFGGEEGEGMKEDTIIGKFINVAGEEEEIYGDKEEVFKQVTKKDPAIFQI